MVDETEAGKGRPTPSRREAEEARKRLMKTPMTRKESARRDRAAREAAREKQREALKTGDDRYLPTRERGPVRKFCRDYVDRRWNIAEFLLPLLVVILVMTFINQPWSVLAVTFLWSFTILATLFDELLLVRGLKKELRQRFDKPETKGATAYSVLRSTQLRRFRLPKPQVGRGEALQQRY